MIRIRTGSSWRHDPALAAALRRAQGPARAVAARAIVDALAIEVDGVDLASGRAEGALLPSFEALLPNSSPGRARQLPSSCGSGKRAGNYFSIGWTRWWSPPNAQTCYVSC